MFIFIYYWLIERTKYFLVSFFLFFFVPKHRKKKSMAKPQKNLRVGPKIIIIFSFQNFFVRFLKEQQTLPKHRSSLQSSVDCTPSAYFSCPSCPPPLFHNLPWPPVLLFPCSFSFLHWYPYCFFSFLKFYLQRIDLFSPGASASLLILPGFTSCIYSLANKEFLKFQTQF